MRSHFKKPHVSVFGVKKYYGGGRTRGYCVIYDNEESMKKYEPNYRFKRVINLMKFGGLVGLITKVINLIKL